MVRLKHRYLLVDILYPSPTASTGAQNKPSHPHPPHLQIHAPTSNALTPSLLAKLVRDEVSSLFGDWGIGRR
ncbi:hypothetical protein BDV59DRAFT_166214 [Aspergillus ambiguus]|uniref:uncharacterized protein n=1 Tax=Aspergillus ambiguus TaxID=176160 RepID=UPI003CCE07A3